MKIQQIVNRGYTQAAFGKKSNYLAYKRAMEKKGYKVGFIRSSGPVTEGGYKRNAYYAIADKKKKIVRRQSAPRRKSTGGFGMGFSSAMSFRPPRL